MGVLMGAVLVATLARLAHAAPGDLDPTFGIGGEASLPQQAARLAIDGAGRILAAGLRFDHSGPVVTRLAPNGTLDPSFGSAGVAALPLDEAVTAQVGLALQPDGLIVSLVAIRVDDRAAIALVRLTTDGRLDPTFGEGGVTITTALPNHLRTDVLLTTLDGAPMVVGGVCDDRTCTPSLVRYDQTGAQRGPFTPLKGLGEIIDLDAALQPDGRLVVVARAFIDADNKTVLARYEPDGRPDRSFAKHGRLVTEVPSSRFYGPAIALARDGRIVVAAQSLGELVARFLPDGKPDREFGHGGITSLSNGHETVAGAVALQPDGAVIVAGATGATFGGFDWAVTALHADGAPATEFGTSGFVVRTPNLLDDVASDVVIQQDGGIVVGGSTTTNGLVGRYLGFRRACADADGDTTVTVTDGVQVLRAAAALPSACRVEVCDVDGSGAVTVTDGVQTLRAAAELPTDLRCP